MATPDRQAVLNDIAKTIRGLIRVVTVDGTQSAVTVKGWDHDLMLFIESHHWPPHPDISGKFMLDGQRKELAPLPDTKQLTIRQDKLIWQPLTHYEVMDKCLSATREKRSDVVIKGRSFAVSRLELMLARSPRDLNFASGVMVATLCGLCGDYRLYVRGSYWQPPLHDAVSAALDALEGEL